MGLVDLHGRVDEAAIQSLLLLASGSTTSVREATHRYVRQEWMLVGWEEAAQIVACVGISREDEQTLRLRSMAVANDWQGRGVGRALIDAVVEIAGAMSLVAETDEDAVGFYRSCGFEVELAAPKAGRARFRCLRARDAGTRPAPTLIEIEERIRQKTRSDWRCG